MQKIQARLTRIFNRVNIRRKVLRAILSVGSFADFGARLPISLSGEFGKIMPRLGDGRKPRGHINRKNNM